MMPDKKLRVVLTFLSFPLVAYLQDISGDFNPDYNRDISCAGNISLQINDNARSAQVLCSGAPFHASSLRDCTEYSQFRSVALMNCLLPSPDIAEVLENFRPTCILVHLNVSWNFDKIVVRNLPDLLCLVLSIKKNVTFELENLDSLRSMQFLFSYAETIPENFFSKLTTLRNIHLKYGETRYLPEKIFRGLRRIDKLVLAFNKLEELPELVFDGLKMLDILDLSQNRLSSLPPKIFHGLTSLERLFLQSNRLSRLPSSLFRDNVNLKIVVISDNNISSLPADLLQNAANLMVFEACDCNITELAENTFSSSPLLTNITLCNNNLRALSRNTFSENKWLKFLVLRGNALASLPSDIFTFNHRLVWLDLSRNSLESIEKETFRNTTFLQNLILRGNRISKIEPYAYANLKNIKLLYLDDNRIGFLPSGTPFGILNELTYLDLSRNDLTVFPRIDWSAYKISFLNLSSNRITSLDVEQLPPSTRANVFLNDNNIESVRAPGNYALPETLKLYDNPFRCNCSLRNFVDAVRSSGVTSLFCSGPSQFQNESLSEIVPSYRLCPLRDTCPDRCRCYVTKDSAVVVNCSSSSLTRAPVLLPPNTSAVHLEHNLLSDIRTTDSWSSVTYLDLNYNYLDPSKFWHLPSSLEFLSIRNNRLNKLSKEFLRRVVEIPQLRVDIRGNRFWCNCSFTYFKQWFDDNVDKIVEADEVMCSRLFLHNNTRVNSSLMTVPLDAFCPPDSEALNVPLVVSGTIVSVIAVALLIFTVVFAKYKNTILAYLYVHFPVIFSHKIAEMDRDKRYDAFVSYTGSDREIAMSMLEELEEKPPFFKLCIHERNWLPGNAIISQIEESIRNSRKTVIVLSEEFLDSVWCETEFQVAYLQCLEEKVDRLIIVVKGTVPVRDLMPVDMQNLLATKTFLVWGERWFWEKLRYSLPHYSRKKPEQHQLWVVDEMIQDFRNKRLI